MRHESGSAWDVAQPGLKIIGRIIAVIVLAMSVAGCGMEANKGSHSASGAATDYVSAIADRDYDRARALRDPSEFKQTVFDNTYFDNERTRMGVTVANPQFSAAVVKDANGATVVDSTTTAPTSTNLYVNLMVSGGPSLLITTSFTTDLWYVSGITKQP